MGTMYVILKNPRPSRTYAVYLHGHLVRIHEQTEGTSGYMFPFVDKKTPDRQLHFLLSVSGRFFPRRQQFLKRERKKKRVLVLDKRRLRNDKKGE